MDKCNHNIPKQVQPCTDFLSTMRPMKFPNLNPIIFILLKYDAFQWSEES